MLEKEWNTPSVCTCVCVCVTSRLLEHTFWIKKLWTLVLEKTLESPLGSKEIKLVNPKGYQPWIFFGKTDAETEAPILWPPDAKNWLIGKDPDAGKNWRWEEKGTTEDEIVWWYHRLIGHEFEQASCVGDGQGSLMCYSPWGFRESNMTEWLKNNNNLIFVGETATTFTVRQRGQMQ